MKTMLKTMLSVLLIGMMLSTAVFAASVAGVGEGTVSADFDSKNVKLPTLTYQNDNIVANGQYMIFVVAGTDGNYVPTADSILYINQVQATEAGAVTFENVYPKTVQNSAIMISGTGFEAPQVIAEINLSMLKGDVDGDGMIAAGDAQEILRCAVGLSSMLDAVTE